MPLAPDIKASLLGQETNEKGLLYIHQIVYDQLMRPSTLSECLKELSLSDRAYVLTKLTPGGSNVLMLAARFQPDYLATLLESICTLDPGDIESILSQRNTAGKNALMQAIQYHSNVLIDWINTAHIREDLILLGGSKKILSIITKWYPEYLPVFLPLISKLDFEKQSVFFNNQTPIHFARQYAKRASDSPNIRSAFAHAETQYQLKKLKRKITNLESRIGFYHNLDASRAFHAATTLYDTLQSSYDGYLHSLNALRKAPDSAPPPAYDANAPTPLDLLKDTWESAIKEAEPVLSHHRGCKATLFKSGIAPMLPVTWMSTDSMKCVKGAKTAFDKEIAFKLL
jgi:hypothetical protein